MRIVTLLENESSQKELKASHGLSLYIETDKHRILFDVGPNNYFMKNAKYMGIRIEDIDMVVISHGHNDHATGLAKFLKLNKTAKIYLSKHVFDEHVKIKGNDHINIGIKQPKTGQDRFVYVHEDIQIDDNLRIVANVPYKPQVIADDGLKVYEQGRYKDDKFHHEIYLVVKEHPHVCLFSGCSHKGIENIVDTIEQNTNQIFTHIFGGYHLSHYDPFNFKETDYLTHLGQKFDKRTSRFYSCHCTGDDAFYQLKIHMREKLYRLRTGDTIIL